MQFIAHGFLNRLFPASIVYACLHQLFVRVQEELSQIPPVVEGVPVLLKMISEVGEAIDNGRNKSKMSMYMQNLQKFLQVQGLDSRTKFSIEDVIDLREKRNWRTNLAFQNVVPDKSAADLSVREMASSLLGKLSVHNLDQLLPKFCSLNIKTRNHLQILAHEIVSAALAMPLNCNLYAKLCAELNKQSDTFAYDIVKLGQKQVNEQQVHYYDVGDGAQGPFPSREAAAHTGRKMCSFKRALLDTCQSIFGEALKNSTVYPGACCEWCEYACSVASGCACVTERICVGCRKRGKGQTTHAGNRAIYCARISQ